MINNVVLVGRIVEEPTLRNFDGEYKGVFITLAINKPFKNFENKVETDFIKVALWEGLAENACSYCHKGDTIGIRGRLSTKKIEVRLLDSEDVKSIQTIGVIGERLTFISSARKKTKDEDVYDDIE